MKPPSSIKRGQRGARPGVPRKNRRQSLLQSQQSVNEENNNSPQRDTEVQTPTPGLKVSTPYAIADMPQFMASGTLKTPLQHVTGQRPEAMGLAGLPIHSGNVAMLAGLPIVVSSSGAIHFNGGALNKSSITTTGNSVNSIPQSMPSPVRISPKAMTKSPGSKNSSNDTAKDTSEQSASDSEQDNSEMKKSEQKQVSEDETDSAKEEKLENDMMKQNDRVTNDVSNKAVHLGMPILVPTYNPNAKAKSKSFLNSLSKRRLMLSGDGSTPKKMPRLILPKQTQNKSNSHISEEGDAGH